MCVAEFFLLARLAFWFWKRALIHRFPAMAAYLVLHLVAIPALLTVLYFPALPDNEFLYGIYFFGHFAVYIASAALILFVCIEIFRSALSAFPGLMKVGIDIFRFAILVSVLRTFSSISFPHRGLLVLPHIAYSLMRSASVIELCLLVFLCLSMNTLQLSPRDMTFGIALCFGLMSANGFFSAPLISAHTPITAPSELANEALVLVSLGIWVAYALFPAKARKPLVMRSSSAIYRWNEIACAVGSADTQGAVRESTNGLFLANVEMAVDEALTRNLKGRESDA